MQQSTNPLLLLLSGIVPLPGRAGAAGLAEVDAEWPSVDDLSVKGLPRLGGTLDVNKVSVGEASGLAGPAVDGNTDVNDVANVAEKVVQVLVGHLERHVADEDGLGRGIGYVFPVVGLHLGLVELADEVAALEDLHVEVLDGRLGVLDGLVLDVSESVRCQFLIYRVVSYREGSPSAQSPVVEDDPNVRDLTKSSENALDLVGGDFIVQIADIDGVARRHISSLAALELGFVLVDSCASLLENIRGDSLLSVGRLSLCVLLHWCEAILGDGLSNSLGEVLGRSCLFLGHNIVAGKSPLESRHRPLLLCAERRCECRDGPGRGKESLRRCRAEGADGGAAEKKPGRDE